MPTERLSGDSSLVDVLDRVLDKGVVIDAWPDPTSGGIVLGDARVVVDSVTTYPQDPDGADSSDDAPGIPPPDAPTAPPRGPRTGRPSPPATSAAWPIDESAFDTTENVRPVLRRSARTGRREWSTNRESISTMNASLDLGFHSL